MARLSDAKRALLLKRTQGQKAGSTMPGITPRALADPAPLSYTQQRVYFLQQLFPESTAYNMFEAWRVHGALDIKALQMALHDVFAQQNSLRTTFSETESGVRQHVNAAVPHDILQIDLSHLPAEAQESRVHELAMSEGNRPFNLDSGPLFRMAAVRLGHEESALLLTLHHIISDEWSNDVFWRELGIAYGRALGGPESDPSRLPIQYTDYAQWQRERVASGAFDKQARYWEQQLGGELPYLQLPFDHSRPATMSLRGGLVECVIPENLREAIQSLSQATGTTPYMIFLAAFQVLLNRYSAQEDILVGTPIANRQRPETNDVMGIFINTAVIRSNLSGNPNFFQLLQQVRQHVLDALANQDLPFDILVQTKQPERDLSYNPLFQTMFVYQSNEGHPMLPGLQLQRIPIDRGVSKFDLTLFVGEEGGKSVAALEFSSDLFERTTAERMLEHWQNLLQGMVLDPDAPIASVNLLSPDEQNLILRTWNNTNIPLQPEVGVHELIAAQARRNPLATAVICDEKQLTYGELDSQANLLALRLIEQGVEPNTLVGLYVERSLEMILGIVGILKAGGAYVPLEPGYPAERISFALQDTQARIVVTQPHLVDRLPPSGAEIIVLDGPLQQRGHEGEQLPRTSVQPDDLAYVIYTSGSTGVPKGVMVSHRNLLASTLARREVYAAPVERYLLLSSFAFDSSVAGIFWTLVDGGTLVLPRPDEEKDVQQVAELIARERITHTLALPILYSLLLTYAPAGALQSLQTVIVAGEACPAGLGEIHYAALPDCPLYNEYGPTEATVWCSVYRLPDKETDGPVPIGRPVPNYQLYVLDNRQQPVPIGVPGELYVAGAGLARGYLNNTQLTSERFPPLNMTGLPEIGRVYRTGDLARWRHDGVLEFLGRVDNQIKLRGFRIEPGEIEAALVGHQTVEEAAVIVHEQSAESRQPDKRLLAYVVGAEANAADLLSFLGRALPDYMVPQQIIVLPELPRTPNGKLDRQRLPAPAQQTDRQRPFVPPRTPTEKTLAGIWLDVLRLSEISVEDRFFELGGDSIMSIQAVARARQEGLLLTPRQLFQEQTIARLAALADSAAAPAEEQAAVSGSFPLTPIQHWFFEQQLQQPDHWNQAHWFQAKTALNISILNRAIREMSLHHPMLRARFYRVAAEWQQEVVEDARPGQLSLVTLAQLTTEEQDSQMLRIANQLHTTLDLQQRPLLAGALFDLGEQRPQRLLLILHHLVVDAVSWGVISADLTRLYQQLARDEAPTPPAATASYSQWSRSLTSLAKSDAMRREAEFWLETNRTPPLLPRDRSSEGENTEGTSDYVMGTLDRAHTAQLLREAHRAYHTRIDDLLLAALARAVMKWTGGAAFSVTLERHGREQIHSLPDVSQTLGWFTSLFPLTIVLQDFQDVGANIRAVKEQLRNVPNNGLGYSILRYLGDDLIQQRLASQPSPEILFNYLGQTGAIVEQNTDLEPLLAEIGRAYGPQNQRAHLLDINAQVMDDRLAVKWQYAPAYLLKTTIERLSESFLAELMSIIDHCVGLNHSQHTPSDFPFADLQQDDLDSLTDLLEGLS